MSVLVSILLVALSRAELIARFKAPVITQADGLIKVYADCPEDLRREYQVPVARFATEVVRSLERSNTNRVARYSKPRIAIHIGEIRTNVTEVAAHAITNHQGVVTRIGLPSPAYADLNRFRTEVIRAYFRGVRGQELDAEAALAAYRAADPAARVQGMRMELEDFLREGRGDFERGTELMRKIIEPGHASRRDVLTFASRLYLYPQSYSQRFLGRFDKLSFNEALRYVRNDPRIRLAAFVKASEMPVFGGGRGATLQRAAYAYMDFLLKLAKGELEEAELKDLLEQAETLLNQAYEECAS